MKRKIRCSPLVAIEFHYGHNTPLSEKCFKCHAPKIRSTHDNWNVAGIVTLSMWVLIQCLIVQTGTLHLYSNAGWIQQNVQTWNFHIQWFKDPKMEIQSGQYTIHTLTQSNRISILETTATHKFILVLLFQSFFFPCFFLARFCFIHFVPGSA